MTWLRAAIWAMLMFLLSQTAFADGKLFNALDDMREPNQKALLWLDGGRETLILQVKYEGSAEDFGWVIPVPNRPEVGTAPSELFMELAQITAPDVLGRRKGTAGTMRAAGGVEPSGVTVIEEKEVGPYSATVLAASDPHGLAKWLDTHGYRMPEGAEAVLKSYVDRGWYYVALQVNTKRLEGDLLAKLRGLDPGLETLEEAPTRLADLLVAAAEAKDPTGRDKAAHLARVLSGDAEGAAVGESPLTVGYLYDGYTDSQRGPDAVRARQELHDGVHASVIGATRAVQTALRNGTIEPVRLTFESGALVYPLLISALSEGVADVQLYVLSDHRMMVRDIENGDWPDRVFRTAFAGKLDRYAIRNYKRVCQVLRDDRPYLTELRAKLQREEMIDLKLTRAPSDDPHRDLVNDSGELVVEMRSRSRDALLVAIGIAVALAAVAVDRLLRRRLRRVP